jgi:hypothetical protein
MNSYQLKLLASKAISALIKAEGIELIYNNKYKTGARSVKIYKKALVTSDVDVPRFKERIEDVANAFNFDVKFKETRGSRWGSPAFIVKL